MTSIADQIDAILLAVDGLTTDMATKSTSTATKSTSTAADLAEVIKLLGRIKRDATWQDKTRRTLKR